MKPHSDERGAALVMALMLLVVLGTVATLSLERSQLVARSTEQTQAQLEALYAAEGGLAQARHALAKDERHAGTTLRVGACEVETVVNAVEGVAGQWEVTVEARRSQPGRPAHRCRIEAVLQATEGLPGVVSWRER